MLPITKEKYISFTKHVKGIAERADSRKCIKLRFIDSFKFLNSLDKLAFLSRVIKNRTFQIFNTIGWKIWNWLVKVSFRTSTLTASKNCRTRAYHRANYFIVDRQYNIRERLCSRRERLEAILRTFGEYYDLYLKTNVLLLADIFENFRESCIASYGLDPAYYYTLPGFTWDAILKYTRGKIWVTHRYRYDYIHWARSQPLFKLITSTCVHTTHRNRRRIWCTTMLTIYTGGRCVNHCHTPNFDGDRCVKTLWTLSAIAPDSPIDYIFEVDLEYSQHLHDQYTDLPFCPTRERPANKPSGKCEDIATLYDKQRYIIHYWNLQQCTRHGLRVTKIHRVLQFAQSP